MTQDDRLFELDSRRRGSFGRIGRPEHRHYFVEQEPDGTIILRPAVVLPASSVTSGRDVVRRVRAVAWEHL